MFGSVFILSVVYLIVVALQEFKNLGLPLHGLINNAGIMMEERNLTQDGFEMVFTANHLSHFMLTLLLIKDLEKTG